MPFSPEKTLKTTLEIHQNTKETKQYKENPHVIGNEISDHVMMLSRLVAYCIPYLEKEFTDEPNLAKDLLLACLFHDDGESNNEISTFVKEHGGKQYEKEFSVIQNLIKELSKTQQEFVLSYFLNFKKRETIAYKLAKTLDNIIGNEFAIIQEISLTQPDYAFMCVEYVKAVYNISKTTDKLIDYQIQNIYNIRKKLKNNLEITINKIISELFITTRTGSQTKEPTEKATKEEILKLSTKIKDQLNIDLETYKGDSKKAYVPIWEWE